MLLVAALCSDLCSQLKHIDAFPAEISAGVSIQLFFQRLLPGASSGRSWKDWTAFPSLCTLWMAEQGKGSINLLQIALQTKCRLVTIPI